ncbi:uncharacterized protein [Primulina huaijiensis]|uniref:uncharacterized protein n=1 Tax=Primulina huaijiensis TaxID=1492673 RepID=UPI003CC72349
MRLGMAGLKIALIRLGGGNRRRKVKIRVIEWWRKVVFPIKRAWSAVFSRVKEREKGVGLLKLHDDIQTCGYEDVQVMWEMLRPESEVMSLQAKRKHRWFWKNFASSSPQIKLDKETPKRTSNNPFS